MRQRANSTGFIDEPDRVVPEAGVEAAGVHATVFDQEPVGVPATADRERARPRSVSGAAVRGRVNVDDASFEQSRLELFRTHGLDGTTEWLGGPGGQRTAAVVGGAGGRTTLLVHGVLSDAGEWALVAGGLDGRVVIPDWPGCGLTAPAAVRDLGLRQFAVDWLSSAVDALGGDQVDIVGSSTGGYFGLVYAIARPDRVRRLVQVGSLPGLTTATPMIFRLFSLPLLGPLLLRQTPKDAEANRKQVFSKLTAHPERIPIEMLEADLAAVRLPNAAASGAEYCRAMVNPLTGVRRELSVRGELGKVASPALFLWGTRDNFVAPKLVEPLLDQVANIELEVIEDAGHLLTLEQPDRVTTSVRAFLG